MSDVPPAQQAGAPANATASRPAAPAAAQPRVIFRVGVGESELVGYPIEQLILLVPKMLVAMNNQPAA